MKTSSVWGTPPSRYYRYLKLLGQKKNMKARYDLGVIGCADGKFVLPAARAGMKVLAIDRDYIALFGGYKTGVGGQVLIDGLKNRLLKERLEAKVDICHSDFLITKPRPCRGVWVSGAIQYSCNVSYDVNAILKVIMKYVVPGGLMYIDYMLPYEEKYKDRPNCPDASWWRAWTQRVPGWVVHYNKVLPPTKDLAHVEFPVDHYHQWGHVLLRRRLE